jgi:hypothetical protein
MGWQGLGPLSCYFGLVEIVRSSGVSDVCAFVLDGYDVILSIVLETDHGGVM